MSKQINVNVYRCNIIDKLGLSASIKFIDELQKWDQTVSRNQLVDVYYDIDVLEMLFKQSQE
jgi:hypothetical protein